MNLSASRRLLMGNSFSDKVFEKVDLRGCRAFRSSWRSCKFISCHFDAGNLSQSTFDDCAFEDQTTLDNVSLVGSTLQNCTFRDCSMIQTDLSSAIVRHVGFVNCNLRYSSFVDSTVTNVSFLQSDLVGMMALYAQAKNVDYTGSNLHNVAMRLGCLFFKDATFDDRQWGLFQALASKVNGISDVQQKAAALVDPAVMALIERLFDGEHD